MSYLGIIEVIDLKEDRNYDMKRKTNIIDDISIQMLDEMCTKEELIEFMNSLPDTNMTGCDGRSLLIHAAFYNYPWLISELLQRGADIQLADDEGYTPLHAAVDSKYRECITILLENGADVNAKDCWGNVPLNRTEPADIDVIELLLKNGADCTVKNNYGSAPIDVFAAYPEVMKLFKKYTSVKGDGSPSCDSTTE